MVTPSEAHHFSASLLSFPLRLSDKPSARQTAATNIENNN